MPAQLPLHWKLFEGILRLLELALFPQLLMALNRLLKPNTRPLSERELALARSIFGEHIDYKKVRLDERSHLGCRRYRFAYVGFHYINSWGALSDADFIHEMVHVWQYQHVGAVYIARALYAQNTHEGYNYGGTEALQKALKKGLNLLDFNYEQQADIVSDYFCLKTRRQPRWCIPSPHALPVFEAAVQYFNKKTVI